MSIQAIKTEADYKQALAEIDSLMGAELNTPESCHLNALVTLVEVYEQEHYPIGLPDPISMLEYHLESRGMSETELIPYIGSSQDVTAVMKRQKALTLEMIRALHQGLDISAEILIQAYDLMPHAHSTNGTEARIPLLSSFGQPSLVEPS